MMGTGPLRALLLQSALAVGAAVLARRAKPAALLLGAAAFFGAPWLAGPNELIRGSCALMGFVGLLRVVDVVRTREPWSAWRRLLHIVSVVDTRTLRRAPRHLQVRALGRALLWNALAAAGFWVAHAPHLLVRWGAGLVVMYASIESGYALAAAAYGALGFVTPRLHVWPVASLSVGELWGRRWARPVSAWLRENCFRPLARRGHPMLGLVVGFAVSAIGHAYPALVALGLPMAAWMFAFFCVQGIVVVIEVQLDQSRWPRSARRGWTIAIMVASSPLFVEPTLRVLGCK